MNDISSPIPPYFPEIQPFATQMLAVDSGHTLYIEQCGNPSGLPVFVLHGGPGSGCNEKSRRRFNPEIYHIICFDQRGAGRSTPAGHLAANTTDDLVRDIETIRTTLGIQAAVLYGTSWGSTLALAYAQTHPHAVVGLVLGGILLGTEDELNWFNLPSGLPRFRYPEYQAIENVLPVDTLSHTSLDRALLTILTGPNQQQARTAAEAYAIYESSACWPEPDLDAIRTYVREDASLVSHIALELHYFAHHFFLQPGQLLANCSRISHIPTHLLQGELDMVCPPASAHKLHAALPQSQLTLVPGCGHIANDTMEATRIEATNAMAARLTI